MLPNTPNFSPTSSDARKSQHLFDFAPNDGPKSLSFGSPLKPHKEDVPLDLFGESLGTASLILEQTPARFLFSFASSVTATENGSGCIYSNQTASKARVPVKRKQPSGMCSCELHKSGQCENKKRLFSNFFQSHLPMFRFDQNTQVPRFDPQTENFKNVLIGHARVWSFAKEFAVTSLMKLARCNLAWQLVHWVMSEHTLMPIFGDLVRFVYNGCTVEGDDLRLILAQFAACVSEEVCLLGGWYELIAEVPSFVVDVMRELAIRCEGDFGVSLLD
ncbi:uncharacterized protein FMAN_09778 [Fusarium mangiferae]|uniref:BTB domain-containing protein n=1 Tax=Fusarium mangiferae TaxID=192010 RepID=A0A1L7TYC6_FUSMA|nr:uncharacterized protein FMAN_09778 [Fusarium mangiferae]CVL00271.1 uncharacterized protein FMAN_09778 [Fusarium mangiferae]